ncbi:MAG: hypothetical protein JW395_3413 [Nitrospira sp.]|nr:hypothetical protein [Nitrospira sp.]
MVVAAVEFREHVAQDMLQLSLLVGSHDERLVHGLTESLNGIGRAGAEHFAVRFDGKELGQREIAFLKTEPADSVAQVAVLDFVFCVAWQLNRRRPAFFDSELSEKGSPSRFQHPP